MTERRKTYSMPLKTALLTVGAILLLGALTASALRLNALKKECGELTAAAQNVFTGAYTELTGAVGELGIALEKLLVAESPRMLALSLDEVWRGSGAVTALMGRLPIPHPDALELETLLARTGDYCRVLSASVLSGAKLTDADRAKLDELARFTAGVKAMLEERLASGSWPTSALASADFYNEGGAFSDEGLTLPELVYDGPMSKSASDRAPLGLSGETLSESECLEKARELLPLLIGGEAELESEGRGEGRIPFCGFSGERDGRRFFISVTERGGALLAFEAEGGPEQGEKPDADALEAKAAALLEKLGYPGSEAVSRQYYGGGVLFGFACTTDGGGGSVLLPGDLIRIRLGGDGSVELIDASACLMNHGERELPDGLLTAEEAAAGLSPRLEISGERLALLPLDDLTERLCWEFRGTAGERGYLVYLDAATGEEVRILRLIEDENGVRTL